MFLRNVGVYLQAHTALQHRRPTLTSSPPGEPHLSRKLEVADVMLTHANRHHLHFSDWEYFSCFGHTHTHTHIYIYIYIYI
jgi:hypothetical protein